MPNLMRACATPLLVLAAALHAGAATAAKPDAPANAGFDLHQVFMEVCVANDDDVDTTVKALEARGARVASRERGMVTLEWSARAPRLMVSLNKGLCSVTSEAADRDATLRMLMASRPDKDVYPLTHADSGVPEGLQYLAGFRMQASPSEDGSAPVMDVIAIQNPAAPKVLSLILALSVTPAGSPPPAPPAARMPLGTAADVAAVFEQACVKPRADANAMVDFVLAQDGLWLGDTDPIGLRYVLKHGERFAAVSWLPGHCSVLVEHLATAELRAAIEALAGRLEGVQEVPEARRPTSEGVQLLVAKRGVLPGDADKVPLEVFLVNYGEGEGVNRHLILLGRTRP